MKAFIFILFFCSSLFSLNANAATAQDNTGEIELTYRPIRTKDGTGSTSEEGLPIRRSIQRQIAYAYIYNKVVSIDFNAAIESATVTITNIVTGETVHAETYSDPTTLNIDLNGENSGSCLIEIEADGTLLTGEFSL
ncbi:MAG: DUF3244 domain-containing protein [Bacteroides sp.]|nr:DUF3244 domain-containing protein [Bacteroides sp.]